MPTDEPLGSLWSLVDGCEEPDDTWQRRLDNWHHFRETLFNPSKSDVLLKALTRTQKGSLKVLLNWWTIRESEDWRWFAFEQQANLENVRPMPEYQDSTYKRRMVELFLAEFVRFGLPIRETRDQLANIRRQAVAAAGTYQLSLACLATAGIQQVNGEAFVREESHRYPLEPDSISIVPCPWLGEEDRTGGLPYYLWDRELRKTIRCPSGNPEYAVISHTWGRWEIKGRKSDVPGALWQVPCVDHDILDIESLPDILARVPLPHIRYIWLDLVCIPQDDGDPLKKVEVARQAAIFASAHTALIWFHQVQSWDGLMAAIRWMSMRYLIQEEGYIVSDATLAQLEIDAEQVTQLAHRLEDGTDSTTKLFFYDRSGPDQRNVLPDGWFTSLWTLQEACLRPDMYLCSDKWQILGVDTGLHVSLDRLVMMFNLMWEKGARGPQLPLSVYEIAGILTKTAMHKLPEMTPIDVLCFGNQRYCETKDRAIAIMSVLGTIAWHDNPNTSSDDPLLFGRYPISFIREVRCRYGAVFFLSVVFTRRSVDDFRFDKRGRITDTRTRGSMLPFMEDVRFGQGTILCQLHTQDHPTVERWVLEPTCHVSVSEACILASWPPRTKSTQPLEVRVHAQIPGERLSGPVDDLNQWLGTWAKKSEKHAICLLIDDEGACLGMLLERVYLYHFQKHFIKIGVFRTPASMDRPFVFPNTKRVKWTIL